MTTHVTAARSALTGEWHRSDKSSPEEEAATTRPPVPWEAGLMWEVRSEETAAVEQANAIDRHKHDCEQPAQPSTLHPSGASISFLKQQHQRAARLIPAVPRKENTPSNRRQSLAV